MKRFAPLLFLAFFGCHQFLNAQDIYYDDFNIGRIAENNIGISPAFDLMGVTPSQVIKPTTSREFRVDWSFRSFQVKPNLDLQVQPIWEIVYNRTSLRKYQQASYFMKCLSTLDISAGTISVQDAAYNDIQRLSVAAKINLFQENDPLQNQRLFRTMDKDYHLEQSERIARINYLNLFMKQTKRTKKEKSELITERDSLEMEYDEAVCNQKEQIRDVANSFTKKYWNSAQVDLAFGKIYTYDGPRLDSLNLQGQAQAVWLNACLGIGRRFLISGMARYTFVIAEKMLLEGQKQMQKGNIFSGGLNVRYGKPKFIAFAEGVCSGGNGMKNAPESKVNKLNQLGVARLSISYGGEWKMGRNAMISFGLRTDYSANLKLESLIPVIGVSCMMR